jgi:purine-nucleoside phosphorylase
MILICSAWHQESMYLKQDWLSGQQAKILHTGIGYLNAYSTLTQFFKNYDLKDYQALLFIGTAGLSRASESNRDIKIGDLVQVNETCLVHHTQNLKLTYLPRAYPSYQASYNTKQLIDTSISKLASAKCFSALEITQNTRLSDLLLSEHKLTQALENMELYGVAKFAYDYQLEWSSILGVTNFTNQNAHQDWLKNHKLVSKSLCKYLMQI